MPRTIFHLCLSSFCAALFACSSAEEDDPGDAASAQDASTSDGGGANSDSGSGDDRDANTAADASSMRDAGSSADAGGTRDAGGASDAGAMDAGASTNEAGTGDAGALPKFSFFVTSLSAMRMLSKSQNGFGGNLAFGETGTGAGLRGADKICAAAAELGMTGASAKEWRAFLSTTTVHAKSRIGEGPWYDRKGRLIAQNLTALLKERPEGAEATIRDDLPNENGEPNHAASAEGGGDDNHDVVTATNASGEYDGTGSCEDWTTTNTPSGGMGQNGPRVGHSWPANSGRNWMAAHRAPGCAPSVALVQSIYCFALTP
jgi:hypothetical protein